MDKKKNNQQFNLICAIVGVVVIVAAVLFIINKGQGDAKKVVEDTKKALTDKTEQIVFVENSKDCKKCSDVKKYLDDNKIKYATYNINNYSKEEYKKFLKDLNINPDDFGYPAVILIKEGIMYANVINITDIKSVEQFSKDYKLKEIK